MSKSKCPECGYRAATAEKWLSAANPFSTDENDFLIGCPKCDQVIKPIGVCDENGCWQQVASTTFSDSGALVRCVDHAVVLPDDENAATYRTDIRGWVDIHGRYHGDVKSSEGAARFASATHGRCEKCSRVTQRSYKLCLDCRALKSVEAYKAAPKESVNGASYALYSEATGQYFFEGDAEIADTQWTRDLLIEKRMYVCIAVDWPLIDTAEDFFGDALPEDVEPPQVLVDAAAAFDDIVRKVPTMAWYPSKVAWNGEFQRGDS